VICDAQGLPLATLLTGANAHDVTQLLPLIEAIPAVIGKVGRPRQRPERVQGDRAYDSEPHREELRQRGIEPVAGEKKYGARQRAGSLSVGGGAKRLVAASVSATADTVGETARDSRSVSVAGLLADLLEVVVISFC